MPTWVLGVFFLTCVAVCMGQIDSVKNDELEEMWIKFNLKYKKVSSKKSDGARKAEFFKNARSILYQQTLFESGKSNFRMKANKFTDLTSDERRKFTGVPPDLKGFQSTKSAISLKSLYTVEPRVDSPPVSLTASKTKKFGYTRETKEERRKRQTDNLPYSKDHRDMGLVTHVKDQGSCGSCWSFSTSGAVEGQMSQIRPLAEQQLVDCSPAGKPTNGGCKGAAPITVLQWLRDNKVEWGLDDSYPYTATEGTCKTTGSAGVKVKTVERIPYGDENALKAAVANKGPVAITVCINDTFFFYDKGVYDNKICTSNSYHAMTAVGYGSENGKDYWLVKNSWGEDWGEKGYVKWARGSNVGFIANWAVYATIEQNPASKLECVDQSIHCLGWSKSGYCSSFSSFMSEKCVASCGKCQQPKLFIRSCEDTYSGCPFWEKNGDCTSDWKFMYKYCTKTCKICTQDQVGDYVAYPDWLLLAAEDLGMTSSAPTTTTAGTTTVQRDSGTTTAWNTAEYTTTEDYCATCKQKCESSGRRK